jgi:hypothetical protein
MLAVRRKQPGSSRKNHRETGRLAPFRYFFNELLRKPSAVSKLTSRGGFA